MMIHTGHRLIKTAMEKGFCMASFAASSLAHSHEFSPPYIGTITKRGKDAGNVDIIFDGRTYLKEALESMRVPTPLAFESISIVTATLAG